MTRKTSSTKAPVAKATPAPAPKKARKTKEWPALDAARASWVAENARPAVAPCLCGCGGTTKGRFVPGHDATLKETLKATDSDVARQALATFGW